MLVFLFKNSLEKMMTLNSPISAGYVALDDIAFSPVHCQNQTGKQLFLSFSSRLEFSFSIDAYGQDLLEFFLISLPFLLSPP